MTSPAVTSRHCSLQLPGVLACATRSARFKTSNQYDMAPLMRWRRRCSIAERHVGAVTDCFSETLEDSIVPSPYPSCSLAVIFVIWDSVIDLFYLLT